MLLFLMNDRRLATSSSRPEGGPLSAFAQASKVPFGTSGLRSGTTMLIGMSLAISFQVARIEQRAFQPGKLRRAEEGGIGVETRLPVRRVRTAIGTLVECSGRVSLEQREKIQLNQQNLMDYFCQSPIQSPA